MELSAPLVITIVVILLLSKAFVVIQQGMMGVVTIFGKYSRVMSPGLNMRVPFIEVVFKKISTQNRSVEMEFQAVTKDQANVYFKSMLLYSVMNEHEETIKAVAFKFIDERSLMQALVRTIEGTIRGFVATKNQAEVLGLRNEIVEHVKSEIDNRLEEWGYHLQDLQINDITFDEAILKSMAQVVAHQNCCCLGNKPQLCS
ncbi:MAG: SPFH domain-containing protein [Flavobacteriales bacterium]